MPDKEKENRGHTYALLATKCPKHNPLIEVPYLA